MTTTVTVGTRPTPAVAPPARAPDRRDRLLVAGAFAVPVAAAVVLSVYEIGSRSLGLDEAASVTIAAQHGGALRAAIAHDGGSMAGYYAVLHVLVGWFGSGATAIRMASAVGAVATVALVCALGTALFDRRVAFASGLLCAVSLPLVYWAQTARGYSLMVAFVTASFLAFVAIAQGRGGRGAWVAYVAFTVLAAYMTFVSLLIVPAQLLALAWRRRALQRVLPALAVAAACCSPLLVLAVQRGSGQLFWVAGPTWSAARQIAEVITSAGFEPNFHRTSTTTLLLVGTLALLTAIAAASVSSRMRADDDRWAAKLMLLWLTVPVVIVLGESWLGQSIFVSRNLVMVLPAAALLLAWGLLRTGVPPLLGWAVVAGLIALRALQVAPSYGVSPENWKAATDEVLAAARPGDCVAFYPTDGRMAFHYYAGHGPRPILPSAQWGENRVYVEDYRSLPTAVRASIAATCPRLWLLSSHEGQADGPAVALGHRARYLALTGALRSAYGAPPAVSSFGYAAPVHVWLFTAAGSSRRT